MRWIALAWQGDFTSSVDVCVAWSLDPRIAQATRDLFDSGDLEDVLLALTVSGRSHPWI